MTFTRNKTSSFILKQAIKGAYKIPFFELAHRSPRFIDIIPFHPIRAGVNITDNCNSQCITCYRWNEQSKDELTLIELSDILYQLRALGIVDLNLTGGEPLLRSDLPEIVHSAHNLKFERISVSTNGLLITRERIEQLVENGLTSINISLNGGEHIHDFTRGLKGAYARTMNAIRTLVELRASKFPHLGLTVQTIVMGVTVDQIIDVANMCLQFGIGISLSPFNTLGPERSDVDPALSLMDQEQLDHMVEELHRMKKTYPALIREPHVSLEYIRHYFVDKIRKDIPCYLGYLTLTIQSNGEVIPGGCRSLSSVGNLRQRSLKQIVDSKAYRASIRQMFLKNCPGCACNHIINLYAHFPSTVEEIKWRFQRVL